ncbi:MAG: TIGR00725 family protein [Synergistales bacterium]|nr:TIGR00725 family protein [Synergistales bacterium]
MKELNFRSKRIISVIGASEADEELWEIAERTGREIARRNCILLCGGRGGVMEGACRGCRDEGGFSVGLLPGGREGANPYLDLVLATHLGEVRNIAVVSAGDGVISIGGGPGTLSEIAFALKFNKPLVTLNSWNVIDGIGKRPELNVALDPAQAMDILFQKFRKA